MALSDYLTDDEWDACLYGTFFVFESPDLGEGMHKTIEAFLESGYRFSGLTEEGHKRQQIPGTRNPQKLLIFLGNPEGIDPREILEHGRQVFKRYRPDLVTTTDDQWVVLLNSLSD